MELFNKLVLKNVTTQCMQHTHLVCKALYQLNSTCVVMVKKNNTLITPYSSLTRVLYHTPGSEGSAWSKVVTLTVSNSRCGLTFDPWFGCMCCPLVMPTDHAHLRVAIYRAQGVPANLEIKTNFFYLKA